MLLPALQKARARGRTISCINNQKQLGIASVAYSNDHADEILRTGDGALIPGNTLASNKNAAGIWAYVLYKFGYNNNNRLLFCPEIDTSNVYSIANGDSCVKIPDGDANYNIFRYNHIGIGLNSSLDWERKGLKTTRIIQPGKKVFGGDSRTVEDKMWRGSAAFSYSYMVGSRHNGGKACYDILTLKKHLGGSANLCWGDGHVSTEGADFLNLWCDNTTSYKNARAVLDGASKPL